MPFEYEPIHAETRIGNILLEVGRAIILLILLLITLFIFVPFLYLLIGVIFV